MGQSFEVVVLLPQRGGRSYLCWGPGDAVTGSAPFTQARTQAHAHTRHLTPRRALSLEFPFPWLP